MQQKYVSGKSSLKGQKVIILIRVTRDMLLSMRWNSGGQQLVLKSVTVTPRSNILVIRRKEIVKFSLLVTKLTTKLCLPLPQ